MARLTTAEQLDAAIRTAAREAQPHTTSREAAEELYESAGPLIEHYTREWVIEKLAGLIRKHRGQLWRENDPQMLLDAEFGFKRLPRRFHFKSGSRLARSQATLRDLRKYRAEIWRTKPRTLEDADKAIALVEPYAGRDPNITLGQVMDLEAKKAGTK